LPLDGSELPKNLTMTTWMNFDMKQMNLTVNNMTLMDSNECLDILKNKGNIKNNKSIIFCVGGKGK
jgi:phosphotransferase system IIB component